MNRTLRPPNGSLVRMQVPKVVRAGTVNNHTGFIMVSANGGLNQQRVAVCNAVAVAYLLNATLVIPKFLYSNVWKDPSQFGDIYQEDTFRNTLKHDINIVKELPSRLKLINLELVGSLVTDADLAKEATPDEYIKNILPILLRNGVVHFLGFGNRLGFDPLPAELQRLRCKCNFHALKFVPKIQKTGSLLLKRIRKHDTAMSVLDKQLIGSFVSSAPSEQHFAAESSAKYLALHLRFEVDMVAYSMCDFGGGDNERRELEAYREEHFPLLLERLKKTKPISPIELRKMGRCPLTPEEAALVLAGLGFNRGTYIYLAGSQIYGGKSRIFPISGLYPNLVTKEDLLSLDELAPFQNFSSQLAALDFIACAASDVFAMTDSGSQLSSLVSGFRTYYGGGNAPILRPSKKRLAAILQENSTITWRNFASRVRKMIEEGQRVHARSYGRSIYRQPRCKECMCRQP
ncbi:O-fucosyltransferase 8 isoform X3 [Andrographis paniculata]|uniref:O-fucosyltransferase 8 isoform X3 n=1 Tax=Andrographis paniculata TaxID=175694 RepID=UPI0021E901EC|nr:O-fucosyltransferase 8 isoform X3 [Andrographis paniculata]